MVVSSFNSCWNCVVLSLSMATALSPFPIIACDSSFISGVAESSDDPNHSTLHAVAQDDQNPTESGKKSPSLGVTNTIEQIVLPGTELTHRPVDPSTTPLIVRVVATFPHGNSFRYDISYFGMSPGDYDLREFLIRMDGTSTDDLPPIPVKINSILQDGQIEPNDLEIGKLSRFGGYWLVLMVSGIIWLGVLLALIFAGRKKQELPDEIPEAKQSLADLLKPAVEKAISGTLAPEKHAELERLLFAFWQNRLGLEQLEFADAISQIRNHEKSGPLIRQLEAWLHSPPGSHNGPSVAELMEPYQQYAAEEMLVGLETDSGGGSAT